MSTTDISILELLASKICHDLISPIGAVNNGLEIFEEMGPDAGKDVTDLISFSANQASAKLQAYRMAYGAGGTDNSIKPEDVYNVIQAMIGAENKLKQDWDPHADFYPTNEFGERPPAFAKILISALLLAMECLPKGGELSVNGADSGAIIITGKGENAGLKNGYADALTLSIAHDGLTPPLTHPFMTALQAKHYNYSFTVGECSDNTVSFVLSQ